ncbi:MAG: hypothetical protein R2761_01020 [Acidimicrobiales bacterium]
MDAHRRPDRDRQEVVQHGEPVPLHRLPPHPGEGRIEGLVVDAGAHHRVLVEGGLHGRQVPGCDLVVTVEEHQVAAGGIGRPDVHAVGLGPQPGGVDHREVGDPVGVTACQLGRAVARPVVDHDQLPGEVGHLGGEGVELQGQGGGGI